MDARDRLFEDRTPGVEEREPTASYLSYTAGLGLAILATIASFVVAQTNLLWAPGIPVGLIVLAFAQIRGPPRLLSASGQRCRQHEQYSGSGLRRADCLSRHHRLCLDHRQSQQQHDADVRAISGNFYGAEGVGQRGCD